MSSATVGMNIMVTDRDVDIGIDKNIPLADEIQASDDPLRRHEPGSTSQRTHQIKPAVKYTQQSSMHPTISLLTTQQANSTTAQPTLFMQRVFL